MGDVVNQIKSRSALLINRKEGRGEVLWQRGYFDRAMRDMNQLRLTIRYIHENPVRAGLDVDPGQWQYSSVHEYSEERLMEVFSLK